MIQILGLRPFTTATGAVKLTDAFHEKGWGAVDIAELFRDMEKYVALIPEEQRWNMFYTVANCTDQKRHFLRQEVLPIDIDGIVRGTEPQIVDAVCEELELPKDKIGIVYSGNGVHLLIGLRTAITDPSYLRNNKPYYRALCGRINTALFAKGLKGQADPVVFSEARLLRLPFTENRKEGKTSTQCQLINRTIVPLDMDLFALADLPQVGEGDHIHPRAMLRMPKPDREAVEAGCGFLQHCRANQATLSEPEWYAMLSIVGRFDQGEKLVHDYSKGHPQYDERVTDEKLKHALEAAGPRTCNNISNMYAGCASCPHRGKITSPIQIVGENTIRTLESGFYNVVLDQNGTPKQGKPNYDDLVKYFYQKHEYVSVRVTEQVMVWNGQYWKDFPKQDIHSFAERHFNPTPTNSMCGEFEAKLKRTNLVDLEWTHVPNKLNFKNGVLDLDTGILEPHNSEYGFTYIIPYDYEPKGDCPTFKKFLKDVSCEDDDLADLIAEYVGYCISGEDPSLVQKCAILHGDGSNGKSVLLHLMRNLVGNHNCSAVSIDSLKRENYRYHLMNKMFNATDEAPSHSFVESSTFKQMTAGDEIEVRKLYGEPIMWKCTAKLVFACNELPFSADFTHGMFRRLIIIPFRQTFSREKGNLDPMILNKLLEERSDIFKYCLEKYFACRARSFEFTKARASIEELDDYISYSDHVDRFIQDTCRFDSSGPTIPINAAYNLFVIWCKDNHIHRPISFASFTRRFGKKMETHFPDVEKARPRQENGKRTVAYKNLMINTMQTATF